MVLKENKNENIIKIYIGFLISIVIVISLLTIGYIYWMTEEDIRIREIESKYYLESINYCGKIDYEIFRIEDTVLIEEFEKLEYATRGLQRELKPEMIFKHIEPSLYIINENIKQLIKLQDLYKQEEFETTVKRANKQFKKIVKQNTMLSEINSKIVMQKNIRAFRTTIDQLRELHDIAHKEVGRSISLKHQKNNQNLLIYVIVLFTIGSFLIYKIIHSINRIMIKQNLNKSVIKGQVKQLEAANKELEEFSYVASHDLQEPLRTMSSFCTMLKDDVGDNISERAKQDINFITDAAMRMNRLVNDLLQLSRAGRSTLNVTDVNLNECMTDLTSDLQSIIKKSNGKVEWDQLPVVKADATQIRQVLQNLVGNALKFHGEDPIVVNISIHSVNGTHEITVSDNGIGIENKYLKQIFTPFKRLHGIGKYEGSGIGLAVCRKIIHRHGGDISVESKPGKGSKFMFTLNVKDK